LHVFNSLSVRIKNNKNRDYFPLRPLLLKFLRAKVNRGSCFRRGEMALGREIPASFTCGSKQKWITARTDCEQRPAANFGLFDVILSGKYHFADCSLIENQPAHPRAAQTAPKQTETLFFGFMKQLFYFMLTPSRAKTTSIINTWCSFASPLMFCVPIAAAKGTKGWPRVAPNWLLPQERTKDFLETEFTRRMESSRAQIMVKIYTCN